MVTYNKCDIAGCRRVTAFIGSELQTAGIGGEQDFIPTMHLCEIHAESWKEADDQRRLLQKIPGSTRSGK